MHKVNILQVVGAMNMGGAEMLLMNIMRNIDREKYKFIFLCYIEGSYDFESEIQELGGEIVRIPDERIANPIRFTANIRKVIKSKRIDIVHSHVDFSSGYAMRAAAQEGIQSRIAHSHNTSGTQSNNVLKNVWFKFLGRQINNYATQRIACAKEAGEFMFGSRSFEILNNGVDVKRFQFNETMRAELRSKLKIGKDDTVILHAGRFEKAKNHTQLIDVFSEYRAIDPTAKLVLLGDGSLFDDVKRKISLMHLDTSVYVMGKQTNTEDYYSAADIFVMPSLYEGLPVTLIEAQMNGLVALVSDTIDKSVNYGRVNFLSLNKTSKQWAKCVYEIDRSHELVSDVLVQDYDIKTITKKVQEIYESK